MLASVRNAATGPRGVATLDRGTVMLESGEVALLDLADHPSHEAWRERGDLVVAVLSDKDARGARKRLDGEVQARFARHAEALAALPPAAPARG